MTLALQPGAWLSSPGARVVSAQEHHAELEAHASVRLPPPPNGQVVVWKSFDGYSRYRVGQRAGVALRELRKLTGTVEDTTWVLDGYAAHKRFDYTNPSDQEVSTVLAFVRRFGPLVLDFGAWCFEDDAGAVIRRNPAYQFRTDLPPTVQELFRADPYNPAHLVLGQERHCVSRAWWDYAANAYAHFRSGFEPEQAPVVPAPLSFYVWAAYLLRGLSDMPDHPGSRLFLANRLASVRLVPAPGGSRSAQLAGELLDYLALAAAYGTGEALAAPEQRRCANPACQAAFETWDRRERYCGACQAERVSDAVRAKRYRRSRAGRRADNADASPGE